MVGLSRYGCEDECESFLSESLSDVVAASPSAGWWTDQSPAPVRRQRPTSQSGKDGRTVDSHSTILVIDRIETLDFLLKIISIYPLFCEC